MFIVLSPAKTLDFDAVHLPQTTPSFLDDAQRLVHLLKTQSSDDLQTLMKLSPKLGDLNHQRYQEWKGKGQKSALSAFQGDVYQGLNAQEWSEQDWNYAQHYLRILSGLYGILKPLDGIEPYRLEMGTRLTNSQGKNLYQFWGEQLQSHLKDEVDQDQGQSIRDQTWLLNLASNEYFKALAVTKKKNPFALCSPIFLDEKKGTFKVISFYAKRARGLLARYVIQNQIKDPHHLVDFNLEGYQYDAERSTLEEPVFIRFSQNIPKK